MYALTIKKSAYEALGQYKPQARQSIHDLLVGLRQSPLSRRRGEVVKLRGYDNLYRVSTLTTRITYEIEWEAKKIVIHLVEPGA